VASATSGLYSKSVAIGIFNGTARFSSEILEGAAEKVWQFIILLKSIYSRNFGYNKQWCIFEHCRKDKTIKNLKNASFSSLKIVL
jgi:hypothetical protein